MLNQYLARLNIALFEEKPLESGLAFAANIEVAEYFRTMLLSEPAQAVEDLSEQPTPVPRGLPFTVRYAPLTADEEAQVAFNNFTSFSQNSSNSPSNAEPDASTNAAPPHR